MSGVADDIPEYSSSCLLPAFRGPSAVLVRCSVHHLLSFEGGQWGMSSNGTQRAACLRSLALAIESDKEVRDERARLCRYGMGGGESTPSPLYPHPVFTVFGEEGLDGGKYAPHQYGDAPHQCGGDQPVLSPVLPAQLLRRLFSSFFLQQMLLLRLL